MKKGNVHDLIKKIDRHKKSLENTTLSPKLVILDDVDLRELCHISIQTAANWREKGMIKYYQPGGKIFYLLSDILAMLKKHKGKRKQRK